MPAFTEKLRELKVCIRIVRIDSDRLHKSIVRAVRIVRHQQMIAEIIQHTSGTRRLLHGLLMHLRRFRKFLLAVESDLSRLIVYTFIRMRLQLGLKLLLRASPNRPVAGR